MIMSTEYTIFTRRTSPGQEMYQLIIATWQQPQNQWFIKLIFDKSSKTILLNEERIASSALSVRTIRNLHVKREVGPLHHIIYKINAKLIKDLNIRAKIISLKRKHRGKTSGSWIWYQFLQYNTKLQITQEKKMNFTTVKNFCASKKTLSRKLKYNPQNGRKYFKVIYLIRV